LGFVSDGEILIAMRGVVVALSVGAIALSGSCLAGCNGLVDTDIGKGIGEVCAGDEDCQGARCVEGLCTVSCGANADCPAPSACFSGLCQLPLKVGLIYVGVPEDEGWTLTHEEGRQFAADELAYLESDFVTNTFLPDDAVAAAETFIDGGADLVVANSFSLRDAMLGVSQSHPETSFLTCSANVTSPNLGTYFARMEQAYFLAGFAAAQKTATRRLGFVGSFITPEVVRHINAFTLGARRVHANIEVEVRWEEFWFDVDPPNAQGKFNETVLAEELLATGCDVIAHNMDNGRVVEAVETWADTTGDVVYSIGNDNRDACVRGPTTCLGTSYWNWGPLYVRLFDQIHRGVWNPLEVVNDNIRANSADSIPNFEVNGAVGGNDLEIAVSELLADLAKPENARMSLRGPYCTTGQRSPDCVGDGEEISDDEMRRMCWFVDGVVEKSNPADPLSSDVPAQVPQPECDTQQ
jgi:basic membrane lipoprotein Med (substrate-binding protein (PBP1-ABC) superfamily)